MKEAHDQKTAGSAVHPSSPDVRKPSHAFNRWFIPVGAVAVHICIGSVYAWSTFNRPIQSLFPSDPGWFRPPYTTFTTALVLLGLSAAFGGPWVEKNGPRVAAMAAACFFGSGLLIGGLGLWLEESGLVCVGGGGWGRVGCPLSRRQAGEMVSGPGRDGDGDGRDGVRGRGVYCGLSECVADGGDRGRSDGGGAGGGLFLHHDYGGVDIAAAGTG